MTPELTLAEIKANENAFVTFMARMILKYSSAVLEEIEEERAAEEQKKSA